METDLGDLCGISELQGKETMPEETHRSHSVSGRDPAPKLHIIQYPEPAMHDVNQNFADFLLRGYKKEGRREKKGGLHLFLGY